MPSLSMNPSEWNSMELIGSLVTLGGILSITYFLFRRLVLERSYKEMKGKTVVITGCDTGFGRETAVRLVKEGCTVLAGCLQADSLLSLPNEVGSLSAQMIALPLDLTDDASIDTFVNSIEEHLRSRSPAANGEADKVKKVCKVGLDGFVSNSGVFAAGSFEWMSKPDIRRVFEINTFGSMELTKRLAPLLDKAGGRLVSMSSVSAVVHGPMLSLYGASKAALDNYHSAIRTETQRKFSVHLILPGGFKTPLLNAQLDGTLRRHWNSTPTSVQSDFGNTFFETFRQNWVTGVAYYADERTSWVVNNVIHALFAAHPRDRYYTGRDALILFAPLTFAPTWLQDVVLRLCNYRFYRGADGKYVKMARSG